jgi:hypothetical protein
MSGFMVACVVAKRRGHETTVDIMEFDLEFGKDLNQAIKAQFNGSDWKVIKIISIKIEKKCLGCRYDRPGQRDHMEVGGCLYQEPSE